MKKFLLRSGLGSLALGMRDKFGLAKTALVNVEAVGTYANDILSTRIITRIGAPGKVFLDIGSHIGSIIAEVHRSDASIRITGFEAIPEKIDVLRKNFPFASFHGCALGDGEGEITFYINEKASGYSSMLAPRNTTNTSIREITVPLKRLDDLEQFEDVDAVKLDVEGAELGVLKGGKVTFTRNRPIIMFESGPGEQAVKEEIWQLLGELGYGVHYPNRVAHNDRELSLDCFLDSHVYPRVTTNYFAIPKEKRQEYRDRAYRIMTG